MVIAVRQYPIDYDFSRLIDHNRFKENETRPGQDLRTEIDHGGVLPEKGVQNCAAAVRGGSDHLPSRVDEEPIAARIATYCSQVGKDSVLPYEGVMRAVGQVGDARDLAGIVDPVGGAVIAAESSDVGTLDRKSTRLNSSHSGESRMPSSA